MENRIEVTGPCGRIMIEKKDLPKYSRSGHTPVETQTMPTLFDELEGLSEDDANGGEEKREKTKI